MQRYVDLNTFDYSYHAFALDPQGRPRFMYEDHYGSIHNGLYYVSCDGNCTDAAQWHELDLSARPDYDGDSVQTPDLAFTAQGQPRIITQLYSNSSLYPEGVYYLTCDQNCDQVANWQRTRLFDRGNEHASWTIALTPSDQPRVAFYQDDLSDGSGNQLYYAWRNTDCTMATNWTKTPVSRLGQNTRQDPVIALDGQARPRIAFSIQTQLGIGYAWCDSQCETTGGQWQNRQAASRDMLLQDFQPPIPANCSIGT